MGSELEGGLHDAAEHVILAVLVDAEDCRGDSDVVANSEAVEDFPHGVVDTIFICGSRTDCAAEGVALNEHVAPLETHIPGIDVVSHALFIS